MRHQKVSNLILAAVFAIAGTMGAQAQTIGVGATKGGAVNQMATAISKVVSSHAGFQLRPIPMASTQALIPVVNEGELEFAMGNMMQVTMAVSGTGMSEGTKYENLRMVATMIPFRWGIAVRADSDIHTIADLKGKRIPHGHDAGPLFHFLYVGILANGGLTYDDVERVPVVLFREGWNAFKQGKVDVALTGVGSGIMKEMNATISGGIRYVPFDDSPAASEMMLQQTPKTYFTVVEPAAGSGRRGRSHQARGLRLHAVRQRRHARRHRLQRSEGDLRARVGVQGGRRAVPHLLHREPLQGSGHRLSSGCREVLPGSRRLEPLTRWP